MERLSFDNENSYDGLEATIHVARYLLASTHCKGRRVLDIACGEGYGSRMLKEWGASEVLGIDVSQEAIEHARHNFGREGVEFHCSPAEDLPKLLAGQGFDLIVSLETIEHLREPERFLADLRQVLNPGGCIIISCPNDWWYFPSEQEKNPYHVRKYHFEEFRSQTEAVLGAASVWLNGAPTFGFLNSIRGACTGVSADSSQLEMLKGQNIGLTRVLPAEMNGGPTDENASYFVGVWGGDPEALSGTAALLPLSMDAFKKGIFQGHFVPKQEQQHEKIKQVIKSLEENLSAEVTQRDDLLNQLRELELLQYTGTRENYRFQEALDDLNLLAKRRNEESTLRDNEMRRQGLLRQAVLAENAEMRNTIHQLKMQSAHRFEQTYQSDELDALKYKMAELQVGHDRYVRLSRLLPGRLRRGVMALKKIIRGS
ncbi:class I SAM-dependent methyltransferase [Janthinobacterium sp. GB4P2]|uniref:class I SAM-dependent methyltransferase n=1 Tax=Janthinobacterium sp. GB4P2 TaxID=3424189 RepID=UPI003F22A25B